MKIFASPAELQAAALSARAAGRRIALVPTMGNLHEGHLSLVRIARTRADLVVLSDFVNPTQFGPNEDFDAYPRTFERDCELCAAEGVDWVFHPAPADMYPPDASVSLVETALSKVLCGASRPGHFNGVCTVVLKLFHIALPHVAVFGQKDAQQLRVLRRMVRDLDVPVEIVPAPIVREPDGLALSSRNQYLSPAERAQAPALRRALLDAEALFAAGERRVSALLSAVSSRLAREAPLGVPDYVALSDDATLAPLPPDAAVSSPALLAIAVRFPSARLIDNTLLAP